MVRELFSIASAISQTRFCCGAPVLCINFQMCAGSLAVEVCCGALQHPQGVRAPAAQHDPAASSATSHPDAALPLGPVPHMIRWDSEPSHRQVF